MFVGGNSKWQLEMSFASLTLLVIQTTTTTTTTNSLFLSTLFDHNAYIGLLKAIVRTKAKGGQQQEEDADQEGRCREQHHEAHEYGTIIPTAGVKGQGASFQ